MFHYFHEYDNNFHHYYRLETDKPPIDGDGYDDVLHVNLSSPLINGVSIDFGPRYNAISEEEFYEILNNVITNLGINLKKFTFV